MKRIQIDRNSDYDFLRFVGIACIILAHVGANGVIFQIRNFDVPLMVLVSGISFFKYSSQSYSAYTTYLTSRFLRIVIPAWIFLIIYNAAVFFYLHRLPSFKDVLLQITLTGGTDIGVWIIRIFFTMAVIAPLVYRLNLNMKNDAVFTILAVCSWIVYELSVQKAKAFLPNNTYVLFQVIIFYTYSYGLVLMYGMRLSSMSANQIKTHIVIFALLFAVLAIWNLYSYSKILPTQQFKYPPLLYYMSYAIFASLTVFYLTVYTNVFNLVKGNALVQYIGKSTMWIYLWHWLCLKLYRVLNLDLFPIGKYFFVFSLAALIAYIQFQSILWLQKRLDLDSKRFRYISRIFIG